jgi:hypothetical protein
MPMIPFVERFPELGARETRSVKVENVPGLPDGEYGFFELYCNEPGCDCRRVIILVLQPETGWRKILATISYGWESVDFYRKRVGPFMDTDELQGPTLDTLNAQSRCSPALLELFRSMIQSPEYLERLKRHYQMFRAAVDSGPKANRLDNRRKRLRDPRRRGQRR